MKSRLICLSALIAALPVLFLSCKKNTDLYWIQWGEGNISYNIKKNETNLRFSFSLVNWHNVEARIADWRFVVKSRKRQLLEINSGNFQTYAPFVKYDDLKPMSRNEFTIQSNNPRDWTDKRPFLGNLFPSYAPDNTDVFVTLIDADGTSQTIRQNLEVIFSRGFEDNPIHPFPNLDTNPQIP